MVLNALNHEYHKIMVDSNNVTTIRTTDGDIVSPPPAYTPQQPASPDTGSEGTLDDDDDNDDEEDDLYINPGNTRSTTRSRSRSYNSNTLQGDANTGENSIQINNKVTVLGSQNILTTAPLDGMRWTASILAILNGNRPLPCQEQQQQQQQRAATVVEGQPPPNAQSVFAQRGGPVNILVDCSVHVVGSRNIVGGNPAAAVYGAVAARENAAAPAQAQSGAVHAATAASSANNNTNDNVAPPLAPSTPPGGADNVAAAPPTHPHPAYGCQSIRAHPPHTRSPPLQPAHQRQQPPSANDSKKRKHAASDHLCSLALPSPMGMSSSSAMASNFGLGFGAGNQTTTDGPQDAQPTASVPAPAPALASPGVVAAIMAQLADAANDDADGPGMRARKRACGEEECGDSDGDGAAISDDAGERGAGDEEEEQGGWTFP